MHGTIALITGEKVEPMPMGYDVPLLDGGGEAEDGSGVSFFMDDAI